MSPMRSLLVVVLALTTAACDKPNYPEPPRDWAAATTWDASSGRFILDGEPTHPVLSWNLAAQSAAFTPDRAAAVSSPATGLKVTGTGDDPVLRSPEFSIEGRRIGLVIVRLTRVRPSGGWDGALYYSTTRRGESGRFMNLPTKGGPPPIGVPTILTYDMTALRAGGEDWSRAIIRQVRLDFDTGAGGEVVLHQVALVETPQ